MQEFTNPFPLTSSPQFTASPMRFPVRCWPMEFWLWDLKPVMADDPREVLDFTKQSQALFINLGHLSAERRRTIHMAASYAAQAGLPMVVDAVGEQLIHSRT